MQGVGRYLAIYLSSYLPKQRIWSGFSCLEPKALYAYVEPGNTEQTKSDRQGTDIWFTLETTSNGTLAPAQ